MTLLSSKDLVQLIEKRQLTMSEVDLFLTHIAPCLSLTTPDKKREWIESIQQILQRFLVQTDRLINGLPGYNHFVMDQLVIFLTRATEFSLYLQKEKGQGILYGKEIVQLRRLIVNQLPKEIRCHVIGQKLAHVGLIDAFSLHINAQITSYLQIDDIEDIGMGHSVYKVKLNQKCYVVKPKESNNLVCFLELLHQVEMPVFNFYSYSGSMGEWEITEYLAGETLSDYLQNHQCSETLITALGHHSALGDLVGRGDRHFENYIVSKGQLYAIDLSYLFWEENDDWVYKYSKAGMTELSVVAKFIENKDAFITAVTQFRKAYSEMVLKCQSHQKKIEEIIIKWSPDPELSEKRVQFFSKRLMDSQFVERRMKQYLTTLKVFLERTYYKQLLQKIVQKNGGFLQEDPLLKMYYLSDYGRWTSFFLLDEFFRGYLLRCIYDKGLEEGVVDSSNDLVQYRQAINVPIDMLLRQISLS